jgi:high-affinity nickel permease
MSFDSTGLTNVFLAVIAIINLVILLMLYQGQKGKK